MGKKHKKSKKHKAKRYKVVQEIKVEENGVKLESKTEEINDEIETTVLEENKNDKKEKIEVAQTAKTENMENNNEVTPENANETQSVEEKESLNDEKKKKHFLRWILVTFAFIILVIVGIILFLLLRPKFKDATIEFGINEVTVSDFLVHEMYEEGSEFITPLEEINFDEVCDQLIILSYKGKEETVTLHIVDTTAPTVTFQNTTQYPGYEVNAEDFIVGKEDLSEMTVEAETIEDTSEYRDYTVLVTIKDIYGNETSQECILTITWIRAVVYKELGEKLSKEDIIVNVEKDGDKLPDTELAKVDMSTIGEYTILAMLNEVEYTSTIIVQDTTPPTLELKDVSIYIGDKVSGKNAFIKTATDVSGEVTTTMKTEIDYSIVGTQNIVIEAVDVNGNSIEKTATLTIKKDTDGPVFSGLSNKTVSKNSTVDYKSGVKAVDVADGTCEFTVDSSSVNTAAAGTYYATYTSKDTKGNTTTAKRKIVVQHNQEDTNNKFNEFYASYLAGQSVLGMTNTIRTKIKYDHSWGDSDPVWYGLTNYSGNCYVHAMILKKALDKAGITNMLIYTTNKSHYWNLVYENGVWRHYDSTPGLHIIGPATDSEKLSSSGLGGRTWDTSAFPAAE